MKVALLGVICLFFCSSVLADSDRYDHLIRKHADAKGLDFFLVKSVIRAESGFNHRIVSNKKAQGLMQLIPATARRFGVTDVYDPDQNIRAGTTYLKWLLDRFNGNVDFALAGYNAGEGRVDQYKGVPPFKETKNYISKIKRFYRSYKGHELSPKKVRSKKQIRPKKLSKSDIDLIVTALGLKEASQFNKVKPSDTRTVKRRVKPSDAREKRENVRLKASVATVTRFSSMTTRVHSLGSQLGRIQPVGMTRYRASKKGFFDE